MEVDNQPSAFVSFEDDCLGVFAPYRATALVMETATTSETSGNFYRRNTRRKNPENTHLHTHRRENLKSHFVSFIHSVIALNSLYRRLCPSNIGPSFRYRNQNFKHKDTKQIRVKLILISLR
jgi:hypothetical protein